MQLCREPAQTTHHAGECVKDGHPQHGRVLLAGVCPELGQALQEGGHVGLDVFPHLLQQPRDAQQHLQLADSKWLITQEKSFSYSIFNAATVHISC